LKKSNLTLFTVKFFYLKKKKIIQKKKKSTLFLIFWEFIEFF